MLIYNHVDKNKFIRHRADAHEQLSKNVRYKVNNN